MTVPVTIALRLLNFLRYIRGKLESWALRIECWEVSLEAARGKTYYELYLEENPRESHGWGGSGSLSSGENTEPLPEHLCKACGADLPPGTVEFCSKGCRDGKD